MGMKITGVETLLIDRYLFVQVHTSAGITGLGESGAWGFLEASAAAVQTFRRYLIGQDPLRIEHHWQHIYRSAFYRGGNVLMTALSGIDQALWDIAGKHFGVPTYALLGGAVRDRVRVYAHWGIGDLSEEGLHVARERLEMLRARGGYTAFKGGAPGKWRAHEPPARIDQFVRCAYLMREWVGPEVELCFDFHGKMTPALAIEVCNELKGMRPMFVEEPVPQENVDALKLVSDHVTFPIATGERLLTRWGFREVLEKGAAALIQPDVSHVGGISELKRVANMAEVYYVHTMPHSAIGPVAFSACLQVDAAVPNFFIQEQVDPALGEGMLVEPWRVRDGHIELPTRPGLGIEIDEAFLQQQCAYTEELGG